MATQTLQDDRPARRKLEIPGTMRDAHGEPQDVVVRDLSISGFRANLEHSLAVGSRVRLGTTALRLTEARVVWSDGQDHGFEFERSITEEDVICASYADNVTPHGDPSATPMPPITLTEIEAELALGKFPRRMRVAILFGSAIACWGFVIAAIASH